jgi:opacity protein-like surface antigen
MKRFVLLCALVVCFTGVASAQEDYSKIDAFAGYSFAHVSANGFGLDFNGGSASVAYNPTGWLGLVGDFGGYHTTAFGVGGNLFTYMFGPRINFRRGKFTPFVQGLIGGGHLTSDNVCEEAVRTRSVHREGDEECGSTSDNGFAMTLGGGLDWNATSHIAVRVAQIEYLLTRFDSTTENGVRISTGVVLHF